jgi:biotin operon repressor
MSHRDLGRVLGVSHATAGKYIQRLKDKGMIDANNRKRSVG